MTTKQARLMRQADGTARLYTPYSKTFVEALKETVPAPWRRWDKGDTSWVISAPAIAQAVAVARLFYEVEDVPVTPFRPQSVATSPYAALHLHDDAPADLVPVVYRHLAKTHHPDKGGDGRQMQRINEAYEMICKAVGR